MHVGVLCSDFGRFFEEEAILGLFRMIRRGGETEGDGSSSSGAGGLRIWAPEFSVGDHQVPAIGNMEPHQLGCNLDSSGRIEDLFNLNE